MRGAGVGPVSGRGWGRVSGTQKTVATPGDTLDRRGQARRFAKGFGTFRGRRTAHSRASGKSGAGRGSGGQTPGAYHERIKQPQVRFPVLRQIKASGPIGRILGA